MPKDSSFLGMNNLRKRNIITHSIVLKFNYAKDIFNAILTNNRSAICAYDVSIFNIYLIIAFFNFPKYLNIFDIHNSKHLKSCNTILSRKKVKNRSDGQAQY